MEIEGFELSGDERVGEGGILRIRRLRLRLVGADGAKTREGTWDFVERPMGLDAVVLALWHRAGRRIEVLLRSGVRVPLHFGRSRKPASMLFPELVAGIVEPGEDDEKALRVRCSEEAWEEAGLRVPPERFSRLGPGMFPTPGMCPEIFHFFAAEVLEAARKAAPPPKGDGSPFEEGAQLDWVGLDEALSRCAAGGIQDLKTEVGLRRLREVLGPPT